MIVMKDKLEIVREWYKNQSNLVKAGTAVGVCILIILIIYFLVTIVFAEDSPLTGDALEKYKASCTVVSFQEINSNINKYKGQHIKFTGQIIQINENNGRTEIVLSVTQVTGGWSNSDLIYITYNNKTSFKKGDIVTVYGAVSGDYSYFTATGKYTLVKITARFIELTPITSPSVVSVPYANPTTNSSNNTINSTGTENISNPTTPTNTASNTQPTQINPGESR
jgi:starvation-inducible outer membrane lipoprotein